MLQSQRKEAAGKRHRLWAEAVPQSDSRGNRLKGGRGQIELFLLWSFVKEHEFPWHCALLKKDGSFHGCGAVLLRFLIVFVIFVLVRFWMCLLSLFFKSLLQLWTRSHHCHCSSLFREVKYKCGSFEINFEPKLTENQTLRTSWCLAEPTMLVQTLQVLWILTKFACRQRRYCTIILQNEIWISPKRFCATRTSAGWQLTAQFLERTTGTHPVSASLKTTLPSSKWTERCLARGRRFGRPVFLLQSVYTEIH